MVASRKSSPIPSIPRNSVLHMPEKRSSLPGMRRKFGRLHKRQSSPAASLSGDPMRQTSMTSFVSHAEPKQQPKQQPKHPARPAPQSFSVPTDSSQILKGVVACLDIRTDDGDDVSQTFERELQSMGAKTRKTFSDSITHLIFKNGSSTTLRKALSKHVNIVNLLWIRRCKREGKRLPEKDFLIDRPQSLVLAGSKRRKSMEPGKVRGLMTDNDSSPTAERFQSGSLRKRPVSTMRMQDAKEKRQKSRSESKASDALDSNGTSEPASASRADQTSISRLLSRDRRTTLEKSNWTTTDMDDTDSVEDEEACPPIENADAVPLSTHAQASSENTAEEHESTTNSVSAPRPQVRKEVKDEFYFGDMGTTEKLSRLSVPGGSILAPLRRKRRSLGPRLSLGHVANIDQPTPAIPKSISLSSAPSATSSRSPLAETVSVILPKPSNSMKRHRSSARPALPYTDADHAKTIVMTSIDESRRKQYAKTIARLGNYSIEKSVDDRTACVVVGESRRTETVLLGMLSGRWIVTPQWIEESDKAGMYVPMENYEATAFFPRVSAARKHKRGIDPVTHKHPPILIPRNTRIFVHSSRYRAGLAEELVEKAGGSIVSTENEADMIISDEGLVSDKIVVNDNWILDSIEKWRYLPTDKYLPHSK